MRSVRVLRALDAQAQLAFVASQEPGVAERFPWISASACAESLQLVAPDGTSWQGAAAVEQLLRLLPRSRWISRLFRIPGARPIADGLYRVVARNRYRLGCGKHCGVRVGNSPG